MKKFEHIPVLLKECIEGLNIKKDGIYVDGTLGGAGHSLEIAKRLNTGKQLTLSNLCTIGSYKGILEHGNCFHLAQATIGGFDNEISKRNSNRTAS